MLFVTLAIPIQLESNWVTLGWALQAVLLAWLALRIDVRGLRYASLFVASLALLRFVVADTPWDYRPAFTLILNRYFLGALALAACLAGVAWLMRQDWRRAAATTALLAIGVTWLAMTVEAYSYFDSLARELTAAVDYGERRSLEWTGQMTVSVLWAVIAAITVACVFLWDAGPHSSWTRWKPDTSMGCSSTIQRTPSVYGGVVSDPR